VTRTIGILSYDDVGQSVHVWTPTDASQTTTNNRLESESDNQLIPRVPGPESVQEQIS